MVRVKIILNVIAVLIKDLLGLRVFSKTHKLREFLQVVLHPLEILWWDMLNVIMGRCLILNLLFVLGKHPARLLAHKSSSLHWHETRTAVAESSSARLINNFSKH